MNGKVIILILAFTLVLGSLLNTPLSVKAENKPENVILADDGNVMVGVYVYSDKDEITYHAAAELVDYLTRVTGAAFQLSVKENAPDVPAVLVGRNTFTESLIPELTGDTLGEDDFVIRRVGQYIIIAGSHPRGTMYGVNYFLDYYVGVKWYSPQYTFIPTIPKLSLCIGDDVQIPRFEYREMYVNDGKDEQYRAHNLLNGKYRDRYSQIPQSKPYLDSWSNYWPYDIHNFYKIVPQEEYHSGNQLLSMNEDVRRIASENLIQSINERIRDGKDASYGFSQQDTGWTPDPESKAFADRHGGTLAAPIFDMVGDVAQRVRSKIPNARIGTLAYQFTLQAPTDMTVPDNVVITFAPISKDHGRAINDSQNSFFGENARRWAEVSDNIVIWDYITDFSGGGYIMPYPNLYAMSETIQYLAGFPSFKGYFGQGAHNMSAPESTGFTDLKVWLAARLLWNPDQDYHELIKQFVKGYYGDAAPYIQSYIESLQQSFEQSDSSLQGPTTSIWSSYLTFDLMHKADKLFTKAVEAVADDPVFLNHVQRTRIEVDYTILMRAAEYAKEAADRNVNWDVDFNNRFDRFKTYTADIVNYNQSGTMKSLYDMIELQKGRTVPTIPDLVKDLPESDWMDFQDNTFKLYTPVGTTMVSDPKASDHIAARVRGNADAWAIQLHNTTLPRKGQWKLYANVRVDPGKGKEGDTAFRYGIYPPSADQNSVKCKDVADGEYHIIEFPWIYEYDPDESNNYLWLAPPNSNAIEYLNVDRVFAIKVPSPDPAQTMKEDIQNDMAKGQLNKALGDQLLYRISIIRILIDQRQLSSAVDYLNDLRAYIAAPSVIQQGLIGEEARKTIDAGAGAWMDQLRSME